MDFKRLVTKITTQAYTPDVSELVGLLTTDQREALLRSAGEVCSHYMNNQVHLRAIIEFSNFCACQCTYCGLYSGNKSLTRFRMPLSEVNDCISEAVAVGYRTIIFQSGEDFGLPADYISNCIQYVKAQGDIAVVLSIGDRPASELAAWYAQGADRYLIKHETSDPLLYERLHDGAQLKNRLDTARTLKGIGYQLGGGFMVGLPGQSIETIANDLLLLKELGVEMAGIGPFIPHPCTPLCHATPGTEDLTLRTLAVARLLLPKVHLPATTALATINPNALKEALCSGANVIMRKVEPENYRRMYEIYPRPFARYLTPREQRAEDEALIRSLGFQPDPGRGDGYQKEEE